MANLAAKALNELSQCNMHGVGSDTDALIQFALDYFDDENIVESDPENDSDDEEMALDLPDAPDIGQLMEELESAELDQETSCESSDVMADGNRPSDDTPNPDIAENNADEDSVVVDEAKLVMDQVIDTIGHRSIEDDIRRIEAFACNCSAYKKGKCIRLFDVEYIRNLQMSLNALTTEEKDMFVMGKISCTINMSKFTQCMKRKNQTERKRFRTAFLVEKKVICRDAFRFMHCIGNSRLDSLIKTYAAGDIGARRKNSGGRRNFDGKVLTFDDIKRIVNFISTFAETHAIVLPGRVPGFKRDDLLLLPSHETKSSVWRMYTAAMEKAGHRAAKRTSFRNIWIRLLPHIVRTKPMSDLCWECQKNNYAVFRSANLPEPVKRAKLKKQYDHLDLVAKERSLYRDMVAECKTAVGNLKLGTNEPCSRDITCHYSFDFAQQVHIPSNPLQPGPIYFLVPRKCGIFGITCEGIPVQVNYLVDEGMCTSKGSNAVISYIHHFFSKYGLGEGNVHFHCDNCSGQNKNKFVVWYLIWRTLHRLHKSVTLNFMITGHTKFGPDWCFGLLKQTFRRTEVSCLEDLASVTKKSSVSGVNIPQLVGNEAGEIFVKLLDWQSFLMPYFKPLSGIKKLHHIRIDGNNPGFVFVKETSDGEELAIQLLRNPENLPPATLPNSVTPPGLDNKRQWYLFTKIREFCTESTRDIVCPQPQGPAVPLEESDEEEAPPPPTAKRLRTGAPKQRK